MNTLISTIHQMQELLQYTKSARAELTLNAGGSAGTMAVRVAQTRINQAERQTRSGYN